MRVITTEAQLAEAVEFYRRQPTVVFDLETRGEYPLDPWRNEVFWITLAGPMRVDIIPMGHPHGEQVGTEKEPRMCADGKIRNYTVPKFAPAPPQLAPAAVFDALKPILFDTDIELSNHNIKFDLESLHKYYGEFPSEPYFDTGAVRLCNENLHSYSLEALINLAYKPKVNKNDPRAWDKSLSARLLQCSFSKAASYCFWDGRWTWLLTQRVKKEIGRQGLVSLLNFEMDLLEALLYMELPGAPIDVERLHALDKDLDAQILQCTADLYRLAGREWNFNSPQQKAAIFYGPKREGGQGLRCKKFTDKGNPSCDDEALEWHIGNPMIDAYRRWNDLDKISGTYVKNYLGTGTAKKNKNKNNAPPLSPIDHRIHANFKQFGTKTGRFSCVTGDTLLPTSRGVFRFDEYQPVDGDLVLTHRGNWMPVLRKFDQGVRHIHRVTLDSGEVLRATGDHRVYTHRGWQRVDLLQQGDILVRCVNSTKFQDGIIQEAKYVGTDHVFDIEVDGDHSYVAGGFLNHNCSEPNLQNIPVRDEELGKKVRGLFIAESGFKLVVADYEQIEYAVMAHYSRDPTLISFFVEGRNFHRAVGGMLLGKRDEELTPTEYSVVKNTNFAVGYGAGDEKVAVMSGVSLAVAKDFRRRHQQMLPSLYVWRDKTIRECKNAKPIPHVKTLLGRVRRLPEIRWSNDKLRSEAERQAVNSVIQGSAADINKLSVIRIFRLLPPEYGSHILNVHDENVLHIREEYVDEAVKILEEAMVGEGVQKLLSVPLRTDVKVVDRWSDAKG